MTPFPQVITLSPSFSRRQAGTSLVEVLITVLIVSFGVLTLAKFQASLHRNQTLAKNRSEAQLSAKEVVAAVQASTSPELFVGGASDVESSSAAFARMTTIASTAVGDVSVDLLVSWADSRAAADHTAISTLVAKKVQLNAANLLAASGAGLAADDPSNQAPWTTPSEPEAGPHGDTPGHEDEHEGEHENEHEPPRTPVILPDSAIPEGKRSITGLILVANMSELLGLQVTAAYPCAVAGATYQCLVPNGWSGDLTASLPSGKGNNGNGSNGNGKVLTISPKSQKFKNVTTNRTGSTLRVS